MGLCADCLDRACTLPGLHAGCINRAAELDNAVIAAVKKNLALLVLSEGLRFHRTRIVDDRAHDIAGTPCRHDEVAAICLEHAAVERLRLGERTVNGEVDLACRIGGQAEVPRGCKCRRTRGIRDRTAVLDLCCMQHDEATLCADHAGVDDLGRRILGNRHRDAVCTRKVRHVFLHEFLSHSLLHFLAVYLILISFQKFSEAELSRVCLYSVLHFAFLNANSCSIRKILSKYRQEYTNGHFLSICPTQKNRQTPNGDCLPRRSVNL